MKNCSIPGKSVADVLRRQKSIMVYTFFHPAGAYCPGTERQDTMSRTTSGAEVEGNINVSVPSEVQTIIIPQIKRI